MDPRPLSAIGKFNKNLQGQQFTAVSNDSGSSLLLGASSI